MPENKVLSFFLYVLCEVISGSFKDEVAVLISAETVNCQLILNILLLFLGASRDKMLQHRALLFMNSVGQGGVTALTPHGYTPE